MVTTVVAKSGDDLERIRSRAQDGEAIGKIVAAILEAQSQRAFLEQRLGDQVWPERYPSQEDPFVNIAALVNWTNTGGRVLTRFFDRRPALMGSGDLMQSISSRVKDGVVEIGSALPYASTHQWGGFSTQPVTDTAKKTIRRFIKSERGKPYWFKLAPLTGKMDKLETEVNPRPFLGITPENEREMAEGIEYFVAEGG